MIVWFPIKARKLCTQICAIVVACLLPVVFLLIYAYQFAMWDLDEEENCISHPDHLHTMSNIHPWITGTLYSYAPIIILVFLTTCIIVKQSCLRKGEKVTSQERNFTIMIVLICILFLILTVPLTVFYIILFAAGGHVYQGPEMELVQTIILILALTNHAINFFLYVVSSPAFRKELKMLCTCSSDREADGESKTDAKESAF